MSSRYAPVDEVRILTGGVDLFAVVYELAAASSTGGIWVEAFGTVRGASIIELTGDRHRESVREATLSSMTATVFMNGDTPDIRSVGTLTWRDKRTPQSLTGFVASALCTHVTLRIRPIVVADAAVASRPASKAEATASASAARSAEKPRERAKDAKTDDRLTDEARALDAAVAKLAESTRAKRESHDAQVQSWADLAAAAADESPTVAATPRTSKPAEASVRSDGAIPTWADLASDASLLNERQGDRQASSGPATPSQRPSVRVSSTTSSPARPSVSKPSAAAPAIATPAPEQASFDDMSGGWGSWDDVAAVSEEVVARAKTAATELKRGEVIVHPTLGNCTVLQVMSEHVVMVKPKHESARKITLKLFDLLPTKKAGIYELVKR